MGVIVLLIVAVVVVFVIVVAVVVVVDVVFFFVFVVVFVFRVVVVVVVADTCSFVVAAGRPGVRAERRAETKSPGEGHLQGQASAVRAPRAQRLLVSKKHSSQFFFLSL